MVRFHYYESKETLTLATKKRSHIKYKGDKIQIISDLSPITLAKKSYMRPITSHLQFHKIPYYWGFPFRVSVMKDEIQYNLNDLQEEDTFLKHLGLPPLSADDLLPPSSTPRATHTPSKNWTLDEGKGRRPFSTPQHS